MPLFVCNFKCLGCFELHTESENVVNRISVIFSFQSWQVCNVFVLNVIPRSFEVNNISLHKQIQ